MAVQKQRYTPAEFDKVLNLPENADRILELIDGEIAEKMPSNPYSSAVAARINRFIGQFVDDHDLGYVTGEAGGYIISDENYFAPDVAFISKTRQPALPQQGYNPIPPDLAVEVISPTDSYSDVAQKVTTYLRHGTTAVWVVDAQTRTVAVHLATGAKILTEDDTIEGGDVLPGFTLAVGRIFP